MANFYSEQITKQDQSLPYRNVKANESRGRLRTLYGSYRTPAASPPAVADVVQMVKVPAGFRVFQIFIQAEALSSGAGTAGGDLGDGADVDRFAAAVNLDAAVNALTALRTSTVASGEPDLGFGYEYTVDDTIDFVVTGEAWAASKWVRLYVIGALD